MTFVKEKLLVCNRLNVEAQRYGTLAINKIVLPGHTRYNCTCSSIFKSVHKLF